MKTRDLVLMALFAAFDCAVRLDHDPIVSSPSRCRRFAVFIAVSLLGGRRGTLAVLVYILLGGGGGFRCSPDLTAGVGALFGKTGGVHHRLRRPGADHVGASPGSAAGAGSSGASAWSPGLGCATRFGTAWFMKRLHARERPRVAHGRCSPGASIPYVIPDLLKIALALYLSNRIERRITI